MAQRLVAGTSAHAAAAAAAAMSDQTVGLLLALSSSLFIGASFVIKKRGLRRAGSTGLRAGRQLGGCALLAGWQAQCCNCDLTVHCQPASLPAQPIHLLLTAASRQRWLLLPAGAAVVAGPADNGGWGGGQLCGVRVCARHTGHPAGRAQHHYQVVAFRFGPAAQRGQEVLRGTRPSSARPPAPPSLAERNAPPSPVIPSLSSPLAPLPAARCWRTTCWRRS